MRQCAICPNCRILLVEASSPSFANLGKAVNEAVALGANAVSNSYGGSESSSESSYTSYYNHTGVVITVSSGDNGYGVEVPAAYNTVVAVGGTSLKTSSSSRSWTETAWNVAGSGCSRYINKPNWQKDSGCSRRTVADVFAVADPNTGVSVYDTYGGVGGWLVFGGTNVSSPIIASVYGLAANERSVNAASLLFDVTSSSNGSCGGPSCYSHDPLVFSLAWFCVVSEKELTDNALAIRVKCARHSFIDSGADLHFLSGSCRYISCGLHA